MKGGAARVRVSEVLELLESHAPAGTAEAWDNVGLLCGDPEWRTAGAVVCVDLSRSAIELAKRKKYRLIVNHHPCIFPRSRGLSRFTPDSLVFEAARSGIAVIACHTNFDQSSLEVVKRVSEGLGATALGRLIEDPHGSLLKLVVFVPQTHAEAVRQAICEAGAGQVGNYDSCTFGTRGEGTFRGGLQARPFLGKPGRLERVQELRLETVFPKGLKKPVVKALLNSHPYEEVAYDLYALEQGTSGQGVVQGLGYGFWGEFPSSKPFSEVAKDVTSLFKLNGFWLTEPPHLGAKRVKRIAFAAGKGASHLDAANKLGCDLFITGEAGYHEALSVARRGMAVMELGHRESEFFFTPTVENWLSELGLRTAGEGNEERTQKFWVRSKSRRS